MESVYDTEVDEVLETDATEIIFPDSTEIISSESSLEETSTETVVYVTSTSDAGNTQSAEIVSCLVVIIVALGVTCGVVLGRILWGRIK